MQWQQGVCPTQLTTALRRCPRRGLRLAARNGLTLPPLHNLGRYGSTCLAGGPHHAHFHRADTFAAIHQPGEVSESGSSSSPVQCRRDDGQQGYAWSNVPTGANVRTKPLVPPREPRAPRALVLLEPRRRIRQASMSSITLRRSFRRSISLNAALARLSHVNRPPSR